MECPWSGLGAISSTSEALRRHRDYRTPGAHAVGRESGKDSQGQPRVVLPIGIAGTLGFFSCRTRLFFCPKLVVIQFKLDGHNLISGSLCRYLKNSYSNLRGLLGKAAYTFFLPLGFLYHDGYSFFPSFRAFRIFSGVIGSSINLIPMAL